MSGADVAKPIADRWRYEFKTQYTVLKEERCLSPDSDSGR